MLALSFVCDCCPGFRSFPIDEQITMVQACMFPIVAVVLSLGYNVEKRQMCWFTYTPDEQKVIFNCFDPLYHLEEAMHAMGHVIHDLDPDEIEVAFLCGLHLIDSGECSGIAFYLFLHFVE
jgi:hypothetical protein